ncbi:trans-acting enoyl reductase [Hyphodiscus hymeniophilus]|uniref:Trans-acting enoyl reductase n=1 Tax=Hyphodiscus hymeniophilus TaxID=353542 RepID=A0A9P7AVJ2_9HELO|nr:trans-acting enoyl reductase [Hyphodiscus hymeniophilus]
MSASRQYDIVVFGATGYTGKLAAEHIVKSLPTDLRWALAGRSASKLEAVAAECKSSNSDRIQPYHSRANAIVTSELTLTAIEICELNDKDLTSLAKKTNVLINTIGPYSLYGEYTFKACSENGTHYLDVTGEVAYVADMIKKYEKTAQASGAIMIPQIGIESAPADLVTWSLVSMIREKFSAPTAEVTVSVHELSAKPSGGTLNTVLTLLDVYSFKQLGAANAPYALSPIPGPKTKSPKSLVTKLFGVRVVPDLGILTTSIGASADQPIIQRSWGLLGGNSFYGPNFQFAEYSKARNYLIAVMMHFGLMAGALLLAIPIFRQLARRFVYQPGDGPTKEEYKNDRFEYRGIASPDVQTANPPRAYVRAYFDGSLYAFTGISLAEAAVSILRDGHKLSGGVYTPACLGQKFIDRLQNAGFIFEKKFL